MIKRFFLLLLFIVSTAAHAEMRDLPHINVLATSSLTTPITELTREYSRQNNISITSSFNSTSEQAWKIEEGEAADIFISSHPRWITELKDKNLLDIYSITNLVKNRLVLVSSVNGRVNEYKIPDGDLRVKLEYLNERVIMVFGDPSSTGIGIYTDQAMKSLDRKFKINLSEKLNSKTIKSLSAKNNLYLISKGETAGITFYSDAYKNDEIKVLGEIPEKWHEPIIYQAAVVKGENMEHARNFLHYLQSPEAKEVFKKYGFVID